MTAGGTNFYTTGGTLRPDAPSYVERQADLDLLDGLQQGEFCYVLTSRQMGKSSLMVRTANKLREAGAHIVILDLTAIGQNLSAEQWYDGLLMRAGKQLGLEQDLERLWMASSRLGPCQRFFNSLREVALPARSGTIVFFVDEIDAVRSLPFSTDEFFAAIRECYNRRVEDPEFRRLTFCLLGVATPSDLIRDARTTPFNIGRRVELHDFSEREAAPLAKGLGHVAAKEFRQTPQLANGPSNHSLRQAKRLLTRILYWTGGHPYLTQRFCRATAESALALDPSGIDRLGDELFFSSRAQERDDNLHFVRDRLLRSGSELPGLLELYQRIRSGRGVADDETSPLISILRLSGVAKTVDGRLVERNRIYSRVFDRRWIEIHMPDAELRRQRAAFRRGVIRTTAVSAVVVVAMTIAVLFAYTQAQQARQALAHSKFSQTQTRRTSGLAGQRQLGLQDLMAARLDFGNDAQLRDEVIACLALCDLEPDFTYTNFPSGTTAIAMSPGLTHFAFSDAGGEIHLMRVDGRMMEKRLPALDLPVKSLALSPEGRYIAAGYEHEEQARFAIWNTLTGQRLFDSSLRVTEGRVDFSTNNAEVAFYRDPGVLEIVTLPDGKVISSRPLLDVTREAAPVIAMNEAAPTNQISSSPSGVPRSRDVRAIRFDWSGQRIADAAAGSQWAYIRERHTNQFSRARLSHDIQALAWAPDSGHLALAGDSGPIGIWDQRRKRLRFLPEVHTDAVRDLAFSPDGTMLASIASDRTLNLWCPATGRHVTLPLKDASARRVFFGNDSRHLGVADLTEGVRIWQIHGNREYLVVRAPTQVNAALTDMAFDPEGRVMVGANDLGFFFWDAATGRSLGSLATFSVHSITTDPVCGDILAGTPNGLLRWTRQLTSATTKEQRFIQPRVLPLPRHLKQFSLSEDGQLGIAIYGDVAYRVSMADPVTAIELPIHGELHAPILSARGRWLAARNERDRHLHVWDLQNLDPHGIPAATFGHVRHIAFSPDERLLIANTAHGHQFLETIHWKPVGQAVTTPASEPGGPSAFGTTAEGRVLLALADASGLISLLEFARPVNGAPATKLLARLHSPDQEPATALLFNPQSSRLAVLAGQTIGIWDLNLLQSQLATMHLAGNLPQSKPSTEGPMSIWIDPEIPKPADKNAQLP